MTKSLCKYFNNTIILLHQRKILIDKDHILSAESKQCIKKDRSVPPTRFENYLENI